MTVNKIEFADGANGSVGVSGVAYGGGVISQKFGNVVVDLSGMSFAPQVPLMDTHENALYAKLGEVTPRIEGNVLYIDGSIIASDEKTRALIEKGKVSKWQLSIGATVLEYNLLGEKGVANVNGKKVVGPLLVATKTMLREVSVVAIGADCTTRLDIDAALCGDLFIAGVENIKNKGDEEQMSKENQHQDENAQAADAASGIDVKAEIEAAKSNAANTERQRVLDITAACAGEFPEIQAKAIAEGWDIAQVNAELVKSIRARRPAVGVNVNTGEKSVGKNEVEAALCMRLGFSGDELVKDYGEKTVNAAEGMCDITLKEVIRESIKMSGGTPISSIGISEDDIRAAFSTVSLPGILSNVANKTMLKAFTGVSPVAYRLCSVGNLTDFKETDRFRLTDMGDLEPVGADGEIKEGGLAEEGAKNQLDTYGKKFCLTRKMIINDDLGAFAKIPAMMGQKAARLVDKLFFARLTSNPTQDDGIALFHASHKNYIAQDGELTHDGLKAAITMFESQVDADGQPIGVSPKTLLVPTANKFDAQELLRSQLVIPTGSESAITPAKNVLADLTLDIASSSYLSGKGWYLFGNPNEIDTFEIGFLKGKRTPTVQQGETDFNTLGMWFRVFFDIGVREQDFRGVLYSIGQ